MRKFAWRLRLANGTKAPRPIFSGIRKAATASEQVNSGRYFAFLFPVDYKNKILFFKNTRKVKTMSEKFNNSNSGNAMKATESRSFKTRRLTVSALMMALSAFIAIICALIPGLNLSFGGGITIASMLPIIIVSYMYGVKWGLFTSFVYAIFQMIIGGKTIYALFLPGSDSYSTIFNAIMIVIIDYLIAYTVLGLGGIYRNKFKSKRAALVLGVVTALSLRYLAHVISGAIFYGAFAEWFFTDTVAANWALSKWILSTFSGAGLSITYSLVYNGCYMIPEIIITVCAAVAVAKLPMIKKCD